MDKKQKRPNVVLYTILMIVLFIVVMQLHVSFGTQIIFLAMTRYPQGKLVMSETIGSALILIVMLLFKNSYVFTQPHKKFSKGLFYGLFFIIGSIFLH